MKAKLRKLRKKEAKEQAEMGMNQRGASVAGVGGAKAKTHRAGRKKAAVAKAA